MSILSDLINQIDDANLKERISKEVDKLAKQKKFGLVFEDHQPECTPLYEMPIKVGSRVAKKDVQITDIYTVVNIEENSVECLHRETKEVTTFAKDDLVVVAEFGEPIYPYLKPLDSVCNAPDSDLWHTLIEADNYHALQLLEYLYAGKVDCIYIDPPYNTGAKDWKYNNDYVDGADQYRHSKWLSMMQKRLNIAKKLLNPKDSVLIVTIDEKEYLHLGCLLEEIFPTARMQMISSVINRKGVAKAKEFSRCDEYIYFVMLGDSAPCLTEDNMLFSDDETEKPSSGTSWLPMRRAGTNSLRKDRPNLFYPIYIEPSTGKIVKVGKPLLTEEHIKENYKIVDNLVEVWPIKSAGEEGRWQLQGETVLGRIDKGTVKASSKNDGSWIIQYLNEGALKEIEEGSLTVVGKDANGALIVERQAVKSTAAKSVWNKVSHDATTHGTNLIAKIIGSAKFSFPKSLYAVQDTLNFFVKNKPNALIVDFFAGSGTTLHAVNLLNSIDNGNRHCIIVTNNEVSVEESVDLIKKGFKPGDNEWNNLGVARYVTWPRTVCSIKGVDIKGNELKGNYLGTELPMSKGFNVNANFFQLGFLDKNSVALGRQFKELLPVLWMKAGAIGKCPEINDEIPNYLVSSNNKMAVLINEFYYMEFVEELEKKPDIETVYIVTDSEAGYREMINGLNVKTTYQLYRDYLDNFRINSVRR